MRIPLALCTALVLCLCPYTAIAQDAASATESWLNIGAGYPLPGGLGFGVNYNFEARHLYQAGFSVQTDIRDYAFYAAHLGIGKKWLRKPLLLAAFAGPAVVYGAIDTEDREENFYPLGLVVNPQVFLVPLPEIGLGIELLGTVTPQRSMVAVRLSLQLNTIE